MGLNVTAKLGIAGTVGAILFALGAVLYVVFPDIVANKVKENLKIINGTLTYKSWEEAPIPIYMQYYIFNVTNSADYLNNLSKPILQQLGPYTFREYRKKVNITFDDAESTVSYSQLKWFVFEPNKSVGNLSDNITTLNIPFTSMALKTEGKLTLMQQMMLPNIIKMYHAEPFVSKSVEELLFKGYKDELMIFLAKQKGEEILPNGTFGLQYGQNYTADGVYTVFTGVKDPSLFMKIYKWNGDSHVNFWATEYCNRINGTDGSSFQAPVTKQDTLYLFSTDLCRSLYMRFEEDTSVYGIKTLRFAPPFSALAAPDLEPDNKCFCPKDIECLKSGALAIGICKKGAPIVLTPPHFYQSDDRYYESVIGLNRNKEIHGTVLDIEPTTGVVMKAARRLQINVNVKPLSHIQNFKNFTTMLFPIMWVDENAIWPEARAQGFKDKVFKPLQIGNAVIYALLAIGGFIIAVVIIVTIHTILKKSSSQTVSRKVSDRQMNLHDKSTKPFLQKPSDGKQKI